MVSRSNSALAVVALVVLSAGCLSGGPFGDSSTGTPTVTPADVPTDESSTGDRTTTETPTATATVFDWEQASNEPDPSKHFYVENEWDQNVTMDVRIVRNATAETVHNASYELAPDERQTVYNTSAADPDGVEEFTAVATARNATESVSIETNECYGSAHVIVSADGDLEVFYAIC